MTQKSKRLRQLAAESGFTKIEIPESQGGLGLDFKTRSKVFGVLSAFDFGFAMSIINTHSAALRLSQSAPPKIIDHFFPKFTLMEKVHVPQCQRQKLVQIFSLKTSAIKKETDGDQRSKSLDCKRTTR